MESGTLLTLWANFAPLSLLVWVILISGVLYVARNRGHALIQATSHLLSRELRRLSRHLSAAGAFIRRRNRGYLFALARDRAHRSLNYEFHRITLGVERDLATFPILYRHLSEQIARVDHDYCESVETPPQPPEWLEAVATLTHGPGRNDPAVQRVLEDLTNTLDRAAHQALLEYRAAHRRRHRLLARMQGYWRRVERRLGSMETTVAELNYRSQRIDRAMLRFQSRPTEASAKKIGNAASVRFLIATAILVLAVPVAVVLFQLIARPIAEITAGTDAVAGIAFYDVTAMAMLTTEIVAGTLVLESMGITQLLPAIAALEAHARTRLRLTAAGIFLLMVLGATALAWTRDYLINQDIAVIELLQTGQASFPGPEFHWIPAVTHSALALGFSFLLGSLAIPLESAVQSGRLALGSLLALSLTATGKLCRLVAFLCTGIGRLLIRVYDLVIFIPLRLESVWLQVWHNRITGDAACPDESKKKTTKGFEKRRA